MRCDAQGDNCVSNGWDQYVDVARSNEFVDALWVTVKFALLTVPIGLVLGVGLAVLADKYLRGIGVFRFIFTSTIATSVAVASLMWLFLLQPDIGVLSNIGWMRRPLPGDQVARACCATRARRWRPSPRRASGPASGSRSSS